jgi:hypothetical protein
MLDPRVTLTTTDLMQVAADAIVVEDSGWLRAMRGTAAMLDTRYPALRGVRERAIGARGESFPIGAAVAFALDADGPWRYAVWAITYTYQPPASGAEATTHRLRATPLSVTAATASAVLRAAEAGATTLVMPALGTRADFHALPPVPKKLPRYVMGAAQLAGLQQALAITPSIAAVTLSLSARDHAIFEDLLGRGGARRDEEQEHDD